MDRKGSDKWANINGILLTVAAHAAVLGLCGFSGMKYIYPPPEEKTFLIDFSEEAEPFRIVESTDGREPEAEETDLSKPMELVKKSDAQLAGEKENVAKEATTGDEGDVAQYEPPREKPIDQRALFHAADNKKQKDTLAAQTARRVSDALSAGHASGNSSAGRESGQPNAHLKGRHPSNGALPKPTYDSQDEGTVVVSIWVDQHGNVTKAVAGAEGTTTSDSKLWNAARNAAMKSHFNMDGDAPVLQEGTITYRFTLK